MENLIHSVPEGIMPLFNAYLTKFDAEQLKKIIRMKSGGMEKEQILKKVLPVKIVTPALISELADAKDVETMLSMLKETPFNDAFKMETYEPMISHGICEANSEDARKSIKHFSVALERILDRYVYEKLRTSTLRVDVDVAPCVSRFVGRYADIMNLKILIRSRKMGYEPGVIESFLLGKGRELGEWKLHELSLATNIQEIISETEGTAYAQPLKEALPEYEKTGSVYPLEAALDRELLKTVSALSVEYGLTAGIPIWFAVGKEYEVRNINAILKGVAEGLTPEKIKPLLIAEEAL
jgi:vacuolar-type H+-ATPase subunit C/Vma6